MQRHRLLEAALAAVQDERLTDVAARDDVLVTVAIEVREPRTDADASPVVDPDRLALGLEEIELGQRRRAPRADVPEDVVFLAAKSAVENRRGFESQYTHLPVELSNLTYPMQPEVMWRNTAGVPLHPGAERYYREAGLM